MSPATGAKTVYTPEDLLTMPDGKGDELVNGELVERKTGLESGWVGGRLHTRLDSFCEAHQVGWALTADASYQCLPHESGRVRKPDVSFIRYGRLSGEALPGAGPGSPRPGRRGRLSQRPDRGAGRLRQGGNPLIWVIHLGSRTVMVYRADGTVSRLREDDELSGEDVIPGFRCRVRDILPKPETRAEAAPAGNGASRVG